MIYLTLGPFPKTDSKKLSKHYEKFQEYIQPKQNPVFSRYKFNNEIQGSRPMEQFVTHLRLLAKDCSYGDAENEMIREQIRLFGTHSAKIREKLDQRRGTVNARKSDTNSTEL